MSGSLSSCRLLTISSDTPRSRKAFVSSAAFLRSMPSTNILAVEGGLALILMARSRTSSNGKKYGIGLGYEPKNISWRPRFRSNAGVS